jgi:hypothetical protein
MLECFFPCNCKEIDDYFQIRVFDTGISYGIGISFLNSWIKLAQAPAIHAVLNIMHAWLTCAAKSKPDQLNRLLSKK